MSMSSQHRILPFLHQWRCRRDLQRPRWEWHWHTTTHPLVDTLPLSSLHRMKSRATSAQAWHPSIERPWNVGDHVFCKYLCLYFFCILGNVNISLPDLIVLRGWRSLRTPYSGSAIIFGGISLEISLEFAIYYSHQVSKIYKPFVLHWMNSLNNKGRDILLTESKASYVLYLRSVRLWLAIIYLFLAIGEDYGVQKSTVRSSDPISTVADLFALVCFLSLSAYSNTKKIHNPFAGMQPLQEQQESAGSTPSSNAESSPRSAIDQATYRDLVIFEERLRGNMTRLQKRKRKYEGTLSMAICSRLLTWWCIAFLLRLTQHSLSYTLCCSSISFTWFFWNRARYAALYPVRRSCNVA